MAFVKPFLMDGREYNIHVVKMTRKFSVLDTEMTGRTHDGRMFRDVIGTFYNYSMTVRTNSTHSSDMDDFWDTISQPVESHVCEFPYNQRTLAQRMYVTNGEQPLLQITQTENEWGEITVNYIAMDPEVVP